MRCWPACRGVGGVLRRLLRGLLPADRAPSTSARGCCGSMAADVEARRRRVDARPRDPAGRWPRGRPGCRRGGQRFDCFGLPVSVRGLYTPMLLVTVLDAARASWSRSRPQCRGSTLPDPRSLRRGRRRGPGGRRRAVAGALRGLASACSTARGCRRRSTGAAARVASTCWRSSRPIRRIRSWCGSSASRSWRRRRSLSSTPRALSLVALAVVIVGDVAAAACARQGWSPSRSIFALAGARPVHACRPDSTPRAGTVGAAALRAGLQHDAHADAIRHRRRARR